MDAIEAVRQLVDQGLISVTPDGRIMKLAVRSRYGKVLPIEPERAEKTAKNGYLIVKVWYEGKQYLASAHRVIWSLLVAPIPPGMDVNHKDGNKRNNALTNLELSTRSENHRHAYRTNLRAVALNMPPPMLEKVTGPAQDLRSEGLTYAEIAKRLGISQTLAFRAVKRKSKPS